MARNRPVFTAPRPAAPGAVAVPRYYRPVPADAGIRFGSYVLLRRIARGGMAEVFLAQQRGLEGFDRRVAVKRILPHLLDAPDFVKMFLGEAKLAAQLGHPNIVHIYDFGKVDQDYFIAMEYVDGVHAGQLTKQAPGDRLPPTLVARIGADAATALHYAHELRGATDQPLGLVHRDVSPANLMVSYDGVVKLCDFGIAKAAALTDQRTNPGQVKGKYAYMSPEQTIAAPLDGRSDVFSLAIVLWELLAGRPILPRGDAVAAMRAIRDNQLEPIASAAPHTPPDLARAISWALENRREQRATAAELATALEAFIKAAPDLATPMQLAAWVRTRFPRDASGAHPAIVDAAAGSPHTLAAPPTGTRVAPLTPPVSDDSQDPADDDRSQTVIVERGVRSVSKRITARQSASDALAAMAAERQEATVLDGAMFRDPFAAAADPTVEATSRDPQRFDPDLLEARETTIHRSSPRPIIDNPGAIPTQIAPPPLPPPPRPLATTTEPALPGPPRIPRRAVAIGALIGVAFLSFAIALAVRTPARSTPSTATTRAARDADARDAAPPPPADAATAETTAVSVLPPDAGELVREPTIRADASIVLSLYKVDTMPRGGAIRLDDQRRTAPAQFMLAPGSYQVIAELDGWLPERRDVVIAEGVDLVQDIPFTRRAPTPSSTTGSTTSSTNGRPPPAAPGTLSVRTRPYSQVLHGSRLLGEAPFADLPLPAGNYVLTFKNPRHPTVRRSVTIVAGRPTKVSFDLPPAK